jgi:flagellar hook assembly protein FlgD
MLVPFALPARSRVSLQVYDAVGALVRTLTAAEMPAGFHHALWDGTDERGLRVKPGAYFCRLEAPAYSRIAKLILSD